MAEVTYIGDPDGDGEDHKPRLSTMGYDFKMGKAIIVNDIAHIKKFLGNRFFTVKEDGDGSGSGDGPDTGGKGSAKAASGGGSGGKSAG